MRPNTLPFRLFALAVGGGVLACSSDQLVLPNDGEAAHISIVSGDDQSGTSGAALGQDVVVQVTDGLDRPTVGQRVVFAFAVPDTVETDIDGRAGAKWVLGPTAGTQELQAALIVDGQLSTELLVTFRATATSGTAARLEYVDGDDQAAPVGSALPNPLIVRAVDEFGNPTSGVEVTWTVSGGGSIDPPTVVTGADGRASARRVLGPLATTQHAEARADGLSGSPIEFTHVAYAAIPSSLDAVSGDGQEAPAGFQVSDPLVVRLVDANGNGIGGRPVTWIVGPGDGAVNPVNSTTDPAGFASTRWTLGAGAGSNLANAVFSGLPSVPFTATGTADVPTKLAASGGNNQSATVGATLLTPLSVRVTDANDNPVENVAVAWTAVGGGAVSSASTASDANGIARVNRTLGVLPGPYTTTAAVDGLTGSPVTFTSTATLGPAARLALTTQPSSSATTGDALAQQPVVQLQDLLGNTVAQANVQVTASVSAGATVSGTVTRATDATGKAAFTNLAISGAPDMYTLTFTAGSLLPVTSDAITVGARQPTQIAANSATSQSAQVGTTVPAPPSVVVRDAGGLPVSGVSVTFTVTAGGGSIQPASPAEVVTNANGIATLTSWTLGATAGSNNNTVTAAVMGLAGSPVTFTASGSSGSAAQLAINAGNNQTAPVNSVVPVDPSVLVLDAHGNAVAGVTVTFAVASGGGSITGSTPASNGSGVARLTSWTLGAGAGTQTLTATAPGLTPVTFTATATASTTPSVTSSLNPSTAGELVTFTAAVASAGGTATGDVRFILDGSEAATVTLSGGQATHATSGLAIGPHNVRVEYVGNGGFLPSTSSTITQVVNGVATTTEIVAHTPEPSASGADVTVAVRVTSASGLTPGGTVSVQVGGSQGDSCDASLAAGQVAGTAEGSCAVALPASETLTASYQGDATHAPSTSGPVAHEVSGLGSG